MRAGHFWRAAAVAMTATLCTPLTAAAGPDPAAGPRQPIFPTALSYSLAQPTASPPGANDYGCRPNREHPYPVVLSEGTFENAYDNWAKLAPELAKDGYCVFAPNIGGPPDSPFQATGDIAKTATEFAAYVDRVRTATGASKVDIVGHSQGGMMPRYYIKNLGGANKVDKLIGLTPSNHGTTVDGIVPVIAQLPGGEQVYRTACESCAQQNKGSRFLDNLNAGGETVPDISYTVVATRTDEVVTPYTAAFLAPAPNVRNTTLQDYCAVDPTDHINISYDSIALRIVGNALDPEHAETPHC
jgi:triacylglycerol esterase/lipase EstA (alpha/beta hydrolase family)